MTLSPKSRLLYKFLKFLLPFTVLTITGTSLVLSVIVYRYLEQIVRRDYTQIVKRSAGEIDIFLAGARQHLEGLGLIMAAVKLDQWQKEIAITAFLHKTPEFDYAKLIEAGNQNLLQTGLNEPGFADVRQNIVAQAFSGRFASSGVMRSDAGLPVILMGVPVSTRDRVAEVLLARLNLNSVWNVLEGISIGESGQVYIMDLSGGYIAHRRMDRVVKGPPEKIPEILSKLKADPRATLQWTEDNPDGRTYHIGALIGDHNWVIALSQPVSETYALLYHNGIMAALITALLGAFSVFFALRQSRKFLRPVSELHQQVLALSRGELDRKVDIRTNDEIEALGHAFNEMTDALKAHIAREVESARELVHARNLATLGTASSKINHEIGNFLNDTNMAIFALKGENLSSRGSRILDLLENESRELNTFIRSLLDFARKPQLQLQLLSIEPLLCNVMDIYRQAAEHAGVDLVLDWPETMPPACVDSGLFARAVHNLIKNALDAMPEGGVLRILGNHTDGVIEIRFEDTGCGIDPVTANRIFEPFFSSKSGSGTGLGLPIVQNIVDAHQGAIECRSTPGIGTTFVIRLPLGNGKTASIVNCE